MEKIFIFLQHIVPQHLLSRWVGWLAGLEHPTWLKNGLIHLFVRHFGVDMAEAAEPDPTGYACFNDFFTRPLQAGARPLAAADVVSPVDGTVSQAGDIVDGRILQAKGHQFSLYELLGGDPAWAARFAGGSFATIYLSPRDYHRVHMPLEGKLLATTYIPGELFSVNAATVRNVHRLFARNERLVCYFDTAAGTVAMVLVGAMIVAGIETVWAGQVAPPARSPQTLSFCEQPGVVELGRGEEMGRFKLGSTVILVFPHGAVSWEAGCVPGATLRLGQPLAELASPAAA